MDFRPYRAALPDDTHVRAVLGQRSVGLLPDLLPVQLSGPTVVLGVGVVGGAAVLAEEHRLQTGRRRYGSTAVNQTIHSFNDYLVSY